MGVLVSRQGLIIRVLGDPLYFSTVLPISRIGSPGAEVRLGPSTDPVNPARYSCYVVINAVGERVCVCAGSFGISPDVESRPRRHCRLAFRVFVFFFQSHPGLGVTRTHCGRLCRLNIVPRPTHCNAIGAYLDCIYTQIWVIGFIASFEVLHWPRYG